MSKDTKNRKISWAEGGILVDQKNNRVELMHKRGARLTRREEDLLDGQIDTLIASKVLVEKNKDMAREAAERKRAEEIRERLKGGEK